MFTLKTDLKISTPITNRESFCRFHRLKRKKKRKRVIDLTKLYTALINTGYLPILAIYRVELSPEVFRGNVFDDAFELRDKRNLVCQQKFHFHLYFSTKTT